MNYKNKKVLVYGLGKSGISAIKLLNTAGAEVYAYDDNGIIEAPIGATLISDVKRAADECDVTVISPSVSINTPALSDAVKRRSVIGELELAYDFINSDLIAVGGTNGKTTVTLLINEILNRAGYISYALGNIGIPLSEKVLELTPSCCAVVEVSSFQLESAKEFSPDIAVLTNVTSDHLDRHGSLENYAAVKAKMFEKQINRDIAVINADDETSVKIAKNVKSDIFYFSAAKRVRGAYAENGEIYFEDKAKIHIASVEEIKLKNGFNLQNALAATAACVTKRINPEIIRMVLKSFEPPEYRCRYIGEKRGRKFYNDSKGTNVAATLASVGLMEESTVLILGGRGKGENFAKLFNSLPKNVIHVFVTGENSAEIVESAITNGWYNISHRATLDECVREAAAVKAENVLFSPAAASFDRYSDFRERGKVFDGLFAAL